VAIEKLNVRQIEKLRRVGYHNDGGGLYLKIDERGNKSWVFRFRLRSGRLRQMGLGSAMTFSLKEAREHARECRQARFAGIDPIEARREQRQGAAVRRASTMTFKECAETYIAAHKAGWRSPKSLAAWEGTLSGYVYPTVGALPVAAIDTALVMKAIEPIWLGKTETASRTRGRIEKILDWAATAGYRSGDQPNPARWKGHLENLLPAKSRVAPVKNHEALPYAELPAFMAALAGQTAIGALALRLAILTVTRTGETLGARWDEINFADKLWTIPAERMKGRREHRVALSVPALEILATLQQLPASPFVFPADNPRRPVSNMIMLMTLRRMGRGDLTVHGFRSTFSDWCAERTAFPSEVREMALAHKIPNKVEAAYRRGDLFEKRRQLSEAWARFCLMPVVGVTEATPIRA
jgi:integrase